MATIEGKAFHSLMRTVSDQLKVEKWLTPKDKKPCFRITMEFLDKAYRRSSWL